MSVLTKNRRVLYDYEILETYQAGIVLNGQEVKSMKNGRVSINGSYVKIKDEEAFLLGANVPAYQPANAPPDYDPQRVRKLLLKKSELKRLMRSLSQKGLTLVPLKVYTKNGLIKIAIGLAKGRAKYDKREKIKKQEAERSIKRALSKKMR